MTSMPRQPTVGVFNDRQQVANAVEEFKGLGIGQQQLTIAEPAEGDANGEQMTSSELISALMSSGMSEEEARRYGEEYRAGRTVVMVHSSERPSEVADVLSRYGMDLAAPTSGSQESERLELREERLVVEKSQRERGEVRVRKEVEEVPTEATVNVLRERVEVERVPIDEVVSERREPWQEDDVLVVPVYEERPVVVTELVLREQIRMRHVSATEQEVVEGTIRRERPVVEEVDEEGNVRSREPREQDSSTHSMPTRDAEADRGGRSEARPQQ